MQDVLNQQRGGPITVQDPRSRDFNLQPQLIAAAAGAGKAVLDRVAPQGANLYTQLFDQQVRDDQASCWCEPCTLSLVCNQ